MNRFACAVTAALSLSPCALADPAVTLSLQSSSNGLILPPTATVDWSISFSVSTGDNGGAAMICVDLIQTPANPALFDLPPATGIPPEMANFNRPAGICNPGEGGLPSGFGGVRRGPAGARNLIQIGGAQNTFGQPFPQGSGVGENANVIPAIGQSGSQTLATGSFPAPSACGTYSFSLVNPVANVITTHNNPPAITQVARASSSLAPDTISFTVAPIGDVDLDLDVDIADLTQLLAGYGTTGGATYGQGDLTGDGDIDLDDLTLMLARFGTLCP